MTASHSLAAGSSRRFGTRLLIPAAMALALLSACTSTSGQGSAATPAKSSASVSAVSAAPGSAPAAVVSAAASSAAAPASSAPASSEPASTAPVSAPASSAGSTVSSSVPPKTSAAAPPPVTVTATQTATETVSVASTQQQQAPTTPQSGGNVLGPYGYKSIVLGQGETVAKQDAIFSPTPAVSVGCKSWSTVPSAPISSVLVSKLGVTAIYPRDGAGMHTPEGMKVGWTADQVHAAYPSFKLSDTHEEDGGPWIKVPQNPQAAYKTRFDSNNKVVNFYLVLNNEPCFD